MKPQNLLSIFIFIIIMYTLTIIDQVTWTNKFNWSLKFEDKEILLRVKSSIDNAFMLQNKKKTYCVSQWRKENTYRLTYFILKK
jgi:hypothetical protein